MRLHRPPKDGKPRTKNNRLKVVLAIIFLSTAVSIGRLFEIEILKASRYQALALSQHESEQKLMPKRGRVFLVDSTAPADDRLFPLATNKKFASLYARPEEVAEPEKAADLIIDVVDQPAIDQEVGKLLAELKKEDPEGEKYTPDFLKVKRELEVKLRREKIKASYLGKLTKAGDPFEMIKTRIDDVAVERIRSAGVKGLDFLYEEGRWYPEGRIGGHLVGFVGYQGDSRKGLYGLEGFFDHELAGMAGEVKAGRDARGLISIVSDRDYTAPVNGHDLYLTIDRPVEYQVCQKLEASVLKHGADMGTVIVLEPSTGAIIAMCSYPDFDPNQYADVGNTRLYNNPAIFGDYEPGSIMKTMTLAAAIDAGKITPEMTYTDKGSVMIEGWPKPIKNSDFETKGGHGVVNMSYVLENSLNTGAIFAEQQLGSEVFAQYMQKFGFGEKTGIELETESSGNIASLLAGKIRPVEAATASFGQGISVTPLQMAVAYGAIANGGILMKPYLVREVVAPDGSRQLTQPREIRRVVSERSALLTSGLLVNVLERGHTKRARVPGYYIGGKTGTAQVPEKGGYADWTIHTFVGFGPIEEPRFVVLVRLDRVRDVQYADSSAAPLFAEITEFLLQYYQVPKERTDI